MGADTDEYKKQKIEMVAENENLLDLIEKLSRPEASLPGTSTEVETGTGTSGKDPDPDGSKEKEKSNKKPKAKSMKPSEDTAENHESNKNSNLFSDYMDNFEKHHERLEKEIDEKGLTLDDIIKKFEDEGDGLCNI